MALEKKGDILNPIIPSFDAIHLLTVHAAKGTEYPFVIIIALEQGIFPYYKAKEEWEKDEERRNFFVAMTRTKELLVLSYAKSRRTKYGSIRNKEPSIFLKEIADEIGFNVE
jgi:DNA helicase-2/ATP-dependent DNA helicase PcrA